MYLISEEGSYYIAGKITEKELRAVSRGEIDVIDLDKLKELVSPLGGGIWSKLEQWHGMNGYRALG